MLFAITKTQGHSNFKTTADTLLVHSVIGQKERHKYWKGKLLENLKHETCRKYIKYGKIFCSGTCPDNH